MPDRSDALMAVVAAATGTEVRSLRPLHGGDNAAVFRVEFVDGRRAALKSDRPGGAVMDHRTEAAGLEWLRSAGAVRVPEVLAVGDTAPGRPGFLLLEWIEEGRAAGGSDSAFGRALAELHRAGAPCFGREDRRTTGSRHLPNEPCATWVEFHRTQRLDPLVRLARDGAALDDATITRLEAVAGRLEELGGPVEPPARLHGDLWAGNRVVDRDGESWLIDPAAHGGHREFDLAMMRLFGGFSEDGFRAYDEVAPLADGWASRVALHQLAPLVVHAIKFGGSCPSAVDAALRSLS